ncbi:MAG: hypothetical protein MJA27_23605 [Pseudanabaenales cyanobacterium]|nr:hypothetical protein [Pseudanabaenales cyanobacterium]
MLLKIMFNFDLSVAVEGQEIRRLQQALSRNPKEATCGEAGEAFEG